MDSSRAARRKSLMQMHVTVLLAGATGLFPKYLTVSPMMMTCVRSAFGAAALFSIGRMLRADQRPGGERNLLVLAVSGAILAFHWFTFFQSIRVSTVAIGVLGFGSMTLFST